MAGPTYISNPSLWEQFKHVDSGENFIPMIPRKSQRGGGIFFKRKAYMVPVKPSMPRPPNIQQVTPVAADEERAASDLKEAMRNDEPHMPLKKQQIKRRKKATSIRNRSSAKGKGRFQKKKQRGRKQLKTLRRVLKKKSVSRKKRQLKKKSSRKRKTVKKPSKKRKNVLNSTSTIF